MSKTLAATAGAVILASVAGWTATNTQAPVTTVTDVRIAPMHMMTSGKELRVERYNDLSVVFD